MLLWVSCQEIGISKISGSPSYQDSIYDKIKANIPNNEKNDNLLTFCCNEWVIIVERQMSNYSAISSREQLTSWSDDDDDDDDDLW